MFWVASCTKIVVTIALMQCVEQGLVTLDTVPDAILPELKQLPLLKGWTDVGEPILSQPSRLPTLREILSHQSGICVDISEPSVMRWNELKHRTSNSQSGAMVRFSVLKPLREFPLMIHYIIEGFNLSNGILPSRGMDLFGGDGLGWPPREILDQLTFDITDKTEDIKAERWHHSW